MITGVIGEPGPPATGVMDWSNMSGGITDITKTKKCIGCGFDFQARKYRSTWKGYQEYCPTCIKNRNYWSKRKGYKYVSDEGVVIK
jgi:hypothetical protein